MASHDGVEGYRRVLLDHTGISPSDEGHDEEREKPHGKGEVRRKPEVILLPRVLGSHVP